MKLVITEATGVVGTECIRLALSHPQVTEVVALARGPVSLPEGVLSDSDKDKFKNVVLKDFATEFSKEVKDALASADACIW